MPHSVGGEAGELKFLSPNHPDLWAVFTRLSLFKFSSLLYEGFLLMVSQTRVVQSVFAAGGAGSPGTASQLDQTQEPLLALR